MHERHQFGIGNGEPGCAVADVSPRQAADEVAIRTSLQAKRRGTALAAEVNVGGCEGEDPSTHPPDRFTTGEKNC
jgi:hypothetical protein